MSSYLTCKGTRKCICGIKTVEIEILKLVFMLSWFFGSVSSTVNWFLKADDCQTTPTQHITFAFAETKRWQPLTTYHHHKLLSIQIIIRFEENVKNKHSSHRLSQNAIEAIYLNMKKGQSVMLNLTPGSWSLPTAERMISFYQNDYPICLLLEKKYTGIFVRNRLIAIHRGNQQVTKKHFSY